MVTSTAHGGSIINRVAFWLGVIVSAPVLFVIAAMVWGYSVDIFNLDPSSAFIGVFLGLLVVIWGVGQLLKVKLNVYR